MENSPFIDELKPLKPLKTTIYSGFSMAMLVITRWYHVYRRPLHLGQLKHDSVSSTTLCSPLPDLGLPGFSFGRGRP